jgi:hypothetical protein
MALVSLVGFPSDMAAQIAGQLAKEDCAASRRQGSRDVLPGSDAVFVWAEGGGTWLREVCETRAAHPDKFLMVITPIPDCGIWLDALDAGANDYSCLAPDSRQISWIRHLAAEPRRARVH